MDKAAITQGDFCDRDQEIARDGPKKTGLKRYNLSLPEDLYNELQCLAESEHTTVLDTIRRFIKLGLVVVKIQQDSDAKIVIQEGDNRRELAFII